MDEPLPKDPVIEAYKVHVDRTLIRENLQLTVAERVQKLQEHHEFAMRIRGTARGKKRPT